MVAAKDSRISNSGVYKVRDPFKLLTLGIVLGGFGIFTWFADTLYLEHLRQYPHDWLMKADSLSQGYGAWVALGLNLAFALTFFRLKALWNGVKIDLDASTIEIPGGNISANDLIDYIKPGFLFQHFMRFKIQLRAIRLLNQSTKVKAITRNGRTTHRYRHAINLSGTFGAASVWFESEGKCDEIFAAIRELNSMGEPFLRV